MDGFRLLHENNCNGKFVNELSTKAYNCSEATNQYGNAVEERADEPQQEANRWLEMDAIRLCGRAMDVPVILASRACLGAHR